MINMKYDFLWLLAGHLQFHYHDPDRRAEKRILIIDRFITSGSYGDAIAGIGNE
jgi:hypothetical protein